jgi:hypothetical protein
MADTPPPPPGWNKTLDDLYDEVKAGLRKSVEQPEFAWGWNYERSLLPPGTRFPKEGDVYESTEDLSSSYIITFNAPFSDGGTAVIHRGDRVVAVANRYDSQPISVYAKPFDSNKTERTLVSDKTRTDPKFAGVLFTIKTRDLNSKFVLVSEGPGVPKTAKTNH